MACYLNRRIQSRTHLMSLESSAFVQRPLLVKDARFERLWGDRMKSSQQNKCLTTVRMLSVCVHTATRQETR